MRVRYDLHIHSGLSPCADKEMTPVTVVGFAKAGGLDMVAIADHNAIANVPVALAAGKAFGITVVPAMELQTEEDVHILCLFETFEALREFYQTIPFQEIGNRPEIFGEQLIFDEDDNVVGSEERLLLASACIGTGETAARVKRFGGVAVPAHIDREANGMVQILGSVTEEFQAVEFSTSSTPAFRAKWGEGRHVLIDSDAHTLEQISFCGETELAEPTVSALLERLRTVKR